MDESSTSTPGLPPDPPMGVSPEGPELPVIRELLDDYEFIRELGRGGTAVVYLARERVLGRYVAIKLMHPAYVQDDEAMARLVREAKTISRLQHPNIVMLYGARRLGEKGYALILQYVPGTTVKQRLREGGPFPLPLVERVLHDLGSALQYAHQHRIVHRDIKPENIFLDEDTGAARLADFGIARFWDSDSGLTLPGTALGTPNYMSPEQVDGRRDLDGRSDIYSVGLVAWEMATGRQPWAGETLYNVVYKQKHEELPSLAELCPEMPHYFRKAIEGALKKNPGERWRDAGELLAALTNPYAHLSHPKPQPSSPTPQHSDPTPSRGEQAPPRSEPTPEPTPARAAEPAEALGMEDADTLVITRQDVERSWARSPARENGPARPEEKAATDAARRRTESRPAAESRPGENRPGVDNRAVAEAGPAPQGGRVAPKAAPGAPAPPSPAAAKPAAQPPIPPKPALDPSKMPRWLVAVEEGTVSNGPWALDYGPNPPRRNRPLIVVGVLLVLVAAAIAGVIAYF